MTKNLGNSKGTTAVGDAAELSIVVPAFNAQATIEACLEPLIGMLECGEIHEIVIVDDGSTDETFAIVNRVAQIRVIRLPQQSGPAAARNAGAAICTGSHLWFVDADVVLKNNAAAIVSAELAGPSGTAKYQAFMGSYDETPAAENFLSQYKNLVHRYYHQRAQEEAVTFWSGCGLIERSAFEQLGGFDAEGIPTPACEDIELGYRLHDAGYRIRLIKSLECTHLKEWRLVNLLKTEILQRAVPWSRMLLAREAITDDLNVAKSERFRAVLAFATLAVLVPSIAGLLPLWVFAASLALIVLANFDLLRFFTARRGAIFGIRSIAFHQLYYLYSSASFAYAFIEHWCTAISLKASPRRSDHV